MMLTSLALVLVALALSGMKTTRYAGAATAPPPEQVITAPLYVLRNNGWFYFYTTDVNEMVTLRGQDGWHYIGIACYVLSNNRKLPGSIDVYRLVKDVEVEGQTVINLDGGTYSNHFYTTDKANADNAANALGWRMEGTAFYVSPKQIAGTVPLYRFYKPEHAGKEGVFNVKVPEQHILTTDSTDKEDAGQLIRIEGYVWPQQTALDAANGLAGNVKVVQPPPPPMSPIDQLFSLGCTQDAAKKQITCPSVRGWDTCNFYKNRGELKVSFCTTTADQFAFANMEKDLGSRSCTRFLGRAGEYVCQTLNGAQACKGYLGKKDGLVTKCLSAKQAEMDQDLFKRGCKRFLDREDDYYCKTADGLQTCNNYRLDGRLKTCRAEEK
jgi:hypothetical protein